MCDVGTAALAVSAVSGGLSAYSQIQTGRANAALANANADAQEQAARIGEEARLNPEARCLGRCHGCCDRRRRRDRGKRSRRGRWG